MIGLCSLVVFSRTTICCRVRSSAPRTEWCFTRCRDLSFSCRRDGAEPNRCLLIRDPRGCDLVSRLGSQTGEHPPLAMAPLQLSTGRARFCLDICSSGLVDFSGGMVLRTPSRPVPDEMAPRADPAPAPESASL